MKTEQNGHLEKHAQYSEALNCPFEQWDAEEIMKRMPIYDLQSFAPARRPDDALFCQPNGRRFDSGKVSGVQLASGESLSAPVVINVAGPASSRINAMAGVLDDMSITTRALRQEVVHVPAPEGFNFEKHGMMVSDSDIALYCRAEHGNNILIGSEDPECDTHDWVDDDQNYNREFTDQWTTQAMRFGQRVPSLGIPQKSRGIVDLYDASTDWIPIYDKSCLPGFYMACGTSGNQYKNAPIAGKMMAALVDYCESGNDQDRKPLQFELPYTGQHVSTGFYSRRRPINSESSFSVVG